MIPRNDHLPQARLIRVASRGLLRQLSPFGRPTVAAAARLCVRRDRHRYFFATGLGMYINLFTIEVFFSDEVHQLDEVVLANSPLVKLVAAAF